MKIKGQLGDGTTTDRTEPCKNRYGYELGIDSWWKRSQPSPPKPMAASGHGVIIFRARLGDGTTTNRTEPGTNRNGYELGIDSWVEAARYHSRPKPMAASGHGVVVILVS